MSSDIDLYESILVATESAKLSAWIKTPWWPSS